MFNGNPSIQLEDGSWVHTSNVRAEVISKRLHGPDGPYYRVDVEGDINTETDMYGAPSIPLPELGKGYDVLVEASLMFQKNDASGRFRFSDRPRVIFVQDMMVHTA